MERVDHFSNTLLRSAFKLAGNVHGLGYSWAPCSCSSRRFYLSPVRQEMVCRYPPPFDATCSYTSGPCDAGSIGFCCGLTAKQMDPTRPRRRASLEVRTRWVGWRRWSRSMSAETYRGLNGLTSSHFVRCLRFMPRKRRSRTVSICTSTSRVSIFLSYSVNLWAHLHFPAHILIDIPQQEPIASTSTAPPSLAVPPSTGQPLSMSLTTDPYLWNILDPDAPRDNPVEDKHRRLVRSHRSSPYDRDLKPNIKIRDELAVCFRICPVAVLVLISAQTIPPTTTASAKSSIMSTNTIL